MTLPQKIGFIGASRISSKHRSHLRSICPENKMIVLSQREPSEQQIGTNTVYTSSFNEFLNAAPNWILICTAAANHHQYIDYCAEIADAIFIEKPLAATHQQAKTIAKVAQRGNCPIVVGYNLRFLEGLNHLREELKRGIIGQLYSVQVTVGQNLEQWRPERSVASTVSVQKSLGGGVLRELSHELDIMQLLFSQPLHSTMFATASKYNQFNVEDTAFIHASYGPGLYNKQPLIASINMDFVRQDSTRQMVFIGEKGTLFFDMLQGSLTFKNETNSYLIHHVENDIESSYKKMWTAFSKKQFDRFCSVNEALNTIGFIETLEASCWE